MPNNDELASAIQKRTEKYVYALDQLRDADDNPIWLKCCINDLREAVELTRCLRRLLNGRNVAEIHAAFGAPGDFGYDTPIGAALASVYRGET